jgi:hypothetical protein
MLHVKCTWDVEVPVPCPRITARLSIHIMVATTVTHMARYAYHTPMPAIILVKFQALPVCLPEVP